LLSDLSRLIDTILNEIRYHTIIEINQGKSLSTMATLSIYKVDIIKKHAQSQN
jgi:hypothetical protein